MHYSFFVDTYVRPSIFMCLLAIFLKKTQHKCGTHVLKNELNDFIYDIIHIETDIAGRWDTCVYAFLLHVCFMSNLSCSNRLNSYKIAAVNILRNASNIVERSIPAVPVT